MNRLLILTLCLPLLTALGSYKNPIMGEVSPGAPSASAADIDRWTKQLYSPDPATRSSAAISLLGLNEQKALKPLLNILNLSHAASRPVQKNGNTSVSDKEVLISVIKVFGFKGDDRAIGPLIDLILHDDPDIRLSACEALGNLHSSEAIQRMSANLLNPGFPQESRALLARALGHTMEQEAVEPLISVLKEAKSRELQDTALEALRHVSRQSFGRDPSVWEDWWATNKYKTREQWLRDLVAKLGEANEQLQEQSDALEKELAEKTLSLLREATEKRDHKAILDAMRSEYPEVRVSATKALSQLDNPDAVSTLVTALNDSDKGVRAAAAQALGELGDEKAVEPLLHALNDEDISVRESVARALASFKGMNVVESLINLLTESTVPVATAAAEALGRIGNAEAVEPLSSLLNSKEPKVREVAAIALGKIKDARAVAPLINSLRDPEERVRWYAADSLGCIGSSEGVEPLIELLSKDSPRVRESAAVALGQIGDERAIEPLVQAMKDPDKRVAEQATDALLSVDIQSYEAMGYLADTFYTHEDYNKASQILEKQISKFSTSDAYKKKIPDSRLRLAIAYQQQKDWQKAATQYDVLLSEHNPKNLDIMVALVECLKELKQYDHILELYSSWMTEMSERTMMWWEGRLEIVYLLFEQGNYEKIQKLIDEFQLEDPQLGGPRLKRQFLELAESSTGKAHAQRGRAETSIVP
ncbi:MAG: HEAT repeat domain-containing protein [Candidatus Brocadiales bacterium]